MILFPINAAEQVAKTPSTYLNKPFSVPGQMFMRRWVLINKPANQEIKNLVLELETIEGVKKHYEIKL